MGWVTILRKAFNANRPLRYVSPSVAKPGKCDSARSRRGFCPNCGSQITFEDEGRPDQIDITAGTLDDPSTFVPNEDVFANQRLPWAPAFAGAPAFDARLVRAALKTQYHAALLTLRHAIEACPESLWNTRRPSAPIWQCAYHALFFTHLYSLPGNSSFKQWDCERPGLQDLGDPSDDVMSKSQLLDYWSRCDAAVDGWVDALDLAAPQSGFEWYALPKLDHQIVNIRHIQHHAAALASRLREAVGVEIDWIGGTVAK